MLDLAFRLYTKGLTTQDIGQIFQDTYGKSISKSRISMITKEFEKDRDAWLNRSLESHYYFIYIDALFLPVRRADVSQEAYYVVLGLNRELKREILGVYNIPTESASGWNSVLTDLKHRGLQQVLMVISDGLTGLRSVIEHHFPKAKIQRCLVHKIRHLLFKIRSKDKAQFVVDFNRIFLKTKTI